MDQVIGQTFTPPSDVKARQGARISAVFPSGNSGKLVAAASNAEADEVITVWTCCGGPIVILPAGEQNDFVAGQLFVAGTAIALFLIAAFLSWFF